MLIGFMNWATREKWFDHVWVHDVFVFLIGDWSFLQILVIQLEYFGFFLIFERLGGFGFDILGILVDLIFEEKLLKLLFFNWG